MQIIQSFLVDKGFFLPLRLSCKERLFSKTYPSFLTLKEGSTSHLGLLSSGEKKETALLGARNRYALRLAGHQSPRQIVRDGTARGQLAITCWLRLPFLFLIAVSLCTGRRSNEEYCFILLLIGLPQERCPSGLWRKSYDRHWRLRNGHNDRGCHL